MLNLPCYKLWFCFVHAYSWFLQGHKKDVEPSQTSSCPGPRLTPNPSLDPNQVLLSAHYMHGRLCPIHAGSVGGPLWLERPNETGSDGIGHRLVRFGRTHVDRTCQPAGSRLGPVRSFATQSNLNATFGQLQLSLGYKLVTMLFIRERLSSPANFAGQSICFVLSRVMTLLQLRQPSSFRAYCTLCCSL